jgi:predicted transcriptional regulator YheO
MIIGVYEDLMLPFTKILHHSLQLQKLIIALIKGAFQTKEMVGQEALRLGVSNFTIYNYLKRIRATKGTAIKDIIN